MRIKELQDKDSTKQRVAAEEQLAKYARVDLIIVHNFDVSCWCRVQEAALLKDQLDEKADKCIKLEDQTQELTAQIEPLREALRKVRISYYLHAITSSSLVSHRFIHSCWYSNNASWRLSVIV
jgi:hypothetical protein